MQSAKTTFTTTTPTQKLSASTSTSSTSTSTSHHIPHSNMALLPTVKAIPEVEQPLDQALGNLNKLRKHMGQFVDQDNFDPDNKIEKLQALINDIAERKLHKITSEPLPRFREDEAEIATPKCVVVDTTEKVSNMMDLIDEAHTNSGDTLKICLDCEGDDLGRDGTLDLLNIFEPTSNNAFIVDIQTLKNEAFSIPGSQSRRTLRNLLESEDCAKMMFDCRGDNDALYAHHKISLSNVIDLQLMDYATIKKKPKNLMALSVSLHRLNIKKSDLTRFDYVKGYGKTAMNEGVDEANRAWSLVPLASTALFGTPERDCCTDRDYVELKKTKGRVARGEAKPPFQERPLPKLIEEYCVGDLVYMPAMYKHYTESKIWDDEWKERVAEETAKRLRESKAAEFQRDKKAMADAPEAWVGIK